MKNVHFLVIGIMIGLVIGSIAGYFIAPPKVVVKQDYGNTSYVNETVVQNSLNYINSYLLQPGVNAKLVEVTPYGENLYKLSLEFFQGNLSVGKSDVYLTKDGNTLVLNSIDISEKPEIERTEVSPDDDPYIGNENAEVTIIEFSDFTCPYCAKFELETLPKILERYDGKIKFVFRDFPFRGNASIKAAEAANCANEQGKYWEYHTLLFERQSEWYSNLTLLYTYAEELNLNMSEFSSCVESGKYVEEIMKDMNDGLVAGVSGTPTIFINGIKIEGAKPFENFVNIIDGELKGS
jgi:protein-disulfide isomerase